MDTVKFYLWKQLLDTEALNMIYLYNHIEIHYSIMTPTLNQSIGFIYEQSLSSFPAASYLFKDALHCHRNNQCGDTPDTHQLTVHNARHKLCTLAREDKSSQVQQDADNRQQDEQVDLWQKKTPISRGSYFHDIQSCSRTMREKPEWDRVPSHLGSALI